MYRFEIFPKTIEQAASNLFFSAATFAIFNGPLVFFASDKFQTETKIVTLIMLTPVLFYLFYSVYVVTKSRLNSSKIEHDPDADNYTSVKYDALTNCKIEIPPALVLAILFSVTYMFLLFDALFFNGRYLIVPEQRNPIVDAVGMVTIFGVLIWYTIVAVRRSGEKEPTDNFDKFAADNNFSFADLPGAEVHGLYKDVLLNSFVAPRGSRIIRSLTGDYRGNSFAFLSLVEEYKRSFFKQRDMNIYGAIVISLPHEVDRRKLLKEVDHVDIGGSFYASFVDDRLLMESQNDLPRDRAGVADMFRRIDAVYDLVDSVAALGNK